MKKYHLIVVAFWIGLSLFVTVLSYRLGLGRFQSPGPGLMPFILGILLLIVSLYLLAVSVPRTTAKQETSRGEPGQTDFVKLGFVVLSLLIYTLLIETLGYLISTFLLLIVLFRSAGSSQWRSVIIASTLTVLLTYFVFSSFGLRFPPGILQMR
ncbi:MAG: tripartite tricarboxylate transporter TctB family protein [Thermodesulfobacteriota bacterium]